MNYEQPIRVSKKFKEILDYVRGKCLLLGNKPPTIQEITEVIAKDIDKEKLFQNEFNKAR